MSKFKAPFYTESMLEELDENQIKFPFSDKDATYNSDFHQYELTDKYFYERGRNLQVEIEGTDPEKVKHFLQYLRTKVYQYIYNHNKSTRSQLNYMIAKRGILGYTPMEYRQAFLEAMFLEGCYLLDNGDLSAIAGVDLDTMQNMSVEVMRNQDRDMHGYCVQALKTLGLKFYGKYKFIPQDKEW